MANKHGGVVLVGNYVYGDTEDSGIPFCAELMTGKIMWKTARLGPGLGRDGRRRRPPLYSFCRRHDGPGPGPPKEYTEVGSFKVPGSGERPSWSHPVILDGKLYLREQDHILCYDVRAKAPAPRSPTAEPDR